MIAPASHGSGSSAVARMVRSTSRFSAVACWARVEIQPNRIAAAIHPHSVSDSLPTGVSGGMGPSGLTTPRAAAMAASVALRCHTSSNENFATGPALRIRCVLIMPSPALRCPARAAWLEAATQQRAAPPPPLKGGG